MISFGEFFYGTLFEKRQFTCDNYTDISAAEVCITSQIQYAYGNKFEIPSLLCTFITILKRACRSGGYW